MNRTIRFGTDHTGHHPQPRPAARPHRTTDRGSTAQDHSVLASTPAHAPLGARPLPSRHRDTEAERLAKVMTRYRRRGPLARCAPTEPAGPVPTTPHGPPARTEPHHRGPHDRHPAPWAAPQGPRRPHRALRPACSLAPTAGTAEFFAERLAAVLSGAHPVHRLAGSAAPDTYDRLALLAEHLPLAPGDGSPATVDDVGWFCPQEDAVEAFARIWAAGRLHALAFRLERGADHRWRCCAVELRGTGAPADPELP